MICPLMTKDPVFAPVPCVEACAWKVQGLCSVNVIAQTLYRRQKREEQKETAKQGIDAVSSPG